MTRHPTRRETLQKIGLAAASPWVATVNSLTSKSAKAGPLRPDANDRIEVGVIGIGMRGKFLIANLPPAIRVTALCDCSLDQVETATHPTGRFAELLRPFAETDAIDAKVYQDYRIMLDRQRFDAVIIAAPDHHHASAAILAMRQGAHVYVEKPLAVTIGEGRAMVEAAKRHDRIVQVGSQQRTMQINRRACEFIRDGGLGKVTLVEERNYPGPMNYDPKAYPRQPIPQGLAWDLFCGPTQERAYHQRLWVKDAFKVGYLTWRGWDLFRDYSGHLMTNWGAHSVDMIQYALGKDSSGPTSIEIHPDQIGPFVDDQWHEKTPPLGTLGDAEADRMRFCPVTMTYADGTRVEFKPGVRKTIFHGEKGSMTVGRNDYRADPVDLLPPPSAEEKSQWAGDGHVARPHLQNWVDAMTHGRSLNAPLEVGHRSITVCHLANIARQVGEDLTWDPSRERFGNHEFDAWLDRPRRHGFELNEA